MQNAPSEARESAAALSHRAAWGTALALACLLSGRGSTVTAFTAKANNCFDNNDGLQEAIGQAGATCAYALQQNYCVTNAALAKKYCPVRHPRQLRPQGGGRRPVRPPASVMIHLQSEAAIDSSSAARPALCWPSAGLQLMRSACAWRNGAGYVWRMRWRRDASGRHAKSYAKSGELRVQRQQL